MDPTGGNQPIPDEGGIRQIVANGEIYNYPELRCQLEGHTWRTASDSEAILHLYEDHGANAIGRLDGMFAVAIADGEDLLLARDPIGIKPLYYGIEQAAAGKRLIFASEQKAIARATTRFEEFPPGSLFHTGSGLRTYYEVPNPSPRQESLPDLLAITRRTLEAAVEKRLMSDVPVGAFLSGGLDSSIIAALARQRLGRIHTFSVGTEGSRDLEAARRVAQVLDTDHHEYQLTIEEVRRALPRIIYHLESFDQDLVRSAIPCYFTSRLAADHVKVILTGEGADELFAGYQYYHDALDEPDLSRELRESVAALHNMNLQRVDRCTMAHSIEGRVPFLDVAMIELGLAIPTPLKCRVAGQGPSVEKWILRQACADLLPRDILWRKKEQFDEGSGTVDIIERLVNDWLSDSAKALRAAEEAGLPVRSAEEALYLQIFYDVFESPDRLLPNVARWRGGYELAKRSV